MIKRDNIPAFMELTFYGGGGQKTRRYRVRQLVPNVIQKTKVE